MIQEINRQNLSDINKPNGSFDIIGKIIPVFSDGKWSFSECLFENAYSKTYPNDNEEWETYIDHPDKTLFFYYEGGVCAGQIRLSKHWNQYAYIEDIAVSEGYRKKGIGTKLMERAVEWAKEKQLPGIMLETQDVNLLACRFYAKCGFQIGGVDTLLYANFDNAHEKAVFWYMRF